MNEGTFDYIKHKQVVIFGTGIDGLRCIQILQNNYKMEPEYFIVNQCCQTEFAGYPVKQCEKDHVIGKYILVATTEPIYIEIQKQLKEMGLREFEDFIYYEWMIRKLVLLHGNCHMDIIESYLRSSHKFRAAYSIYPNPRIHVNPLKKIPEDVLKHIDLWIHEDIQEQNPYSYFLSDKYMRGFIKPSAEEIVIPHLFGLGKILFPYGGGVNKKNAPLSNGKDKNGMFPHADTLIDYFAERGETTESIIAHCMDENAMDSKEIIDNFHLYMEKIRLREEQWDIKIYEFLLEHYKKEKLFFDMGHPTNIVLEYTTYHILKLLNIEDTITTQLQLNAHEVPVYPAVRKALQLEWKEDQIRTGRNTKKIADDMDTEEYIREYLYWCYHR